MTQQHYEEIKQQFGRWGSWALWPPGNHYDSSYIAKNTGKLKPYYVFIDLNASRALIDKEPRLSAIFSGSKKYEGSYMTDLIKDFLFASPFDVFKRFNNDEQLLNRNALMLKQELEALGPIKMAYLFGHRVYRLWRKCPALHCFPSQRISHFAISGVGIEDKIRAELGIARKGVNGN